MSVEPVSHTGFSGALRDKLSVPFPRLPCNTCFVFLLNLLAIFTLTRKDIDVKVRAVCVS